MTVSIDACDHSVDQVAVVDEGYTVTFAGDSGVSSITVYKTQDYSGESETVSATGTAVSRSSATGEPDSTGDGQVNFTVVLKDGYTLDSVTATGAYKNVKDTGVENTYRITKISGEVTVNITTQKSETPATCLVGDATGDGSIDIRDVTAIQRHCAEYDTLDGVYALAADVDQDGSITVADATCIQMYLAEFTGGCGSCGEYIEAA